MIGPTACATCRMIRRFLLAFGIGAFLTWQITGSLPFDGENATIWRAFLLVVTGFYLVSIFFRMRQMRQRWRRQG